MLGCHSQAATISQWRLGAVANWLMVAAANNSTRTAETHRHGWRTGIALIAPGAMASAGKVGERRFEAVPVTMCSPGAGFGLADHSIGRYAALTNCVVIVDQHG